MYAESREPAASTSSTAPGGGVEPRADEHDGADEAGREDRPGQRVPERAAHARGRDGPVPSLPGLAPHRHEPIADAGDADFLSGRCGCRRDEEMARQPIVRRASLLGDALDARTPCRREDSRHREGDRQSTSAGWMDTSNVTVTASRRIQPHVEKIDMYM